MSGRQPSESSRASLVDGENPVARQTLIPAARSAVMVSIAPGSGATRPARTDAAYCSSKASFACWALASVPRIRRNTSILDWPIVSCTVACASW
jgi:hypothetical protein